MALMLTGEVEETMKPSCKVYIPCRMARHHVTYLFPFRGFEAKSAF
jgi:hypothetical protein